MVPSFVYLLLLIPILVAQWVGVVAVGRHRRNGPWWCMLFGAIIVPFASLGPILSWFFGMSDWAYFFVGSGILSSFGSLLFMVGFAMHALAFRRVCERVSELEMVIEAQNEELSRKD